jgi:hypothetical protein
VLGNRNSGKSKTWNTLFEQEVRTGKNERQLHLFDEKSTNVFLISGSPEERKEYVEDLLNGQTPKIILCSVQYTEHGKKTINYFISQGYKVYAQWLNPGFSDYVLYGDTLGIFIDLLYKDSIITLKNGKNDFKDRVEEIKYFIYSWAKRFNLLQ